MSFKIGPYTIHSRLLLAPMAGITDRPYRDVCRKFGAGLVSSEMISSDLSLLKSQKTQKRLIQLDEAEPRCVQILGNNPQKMADAARYSVDIGANIIDINMGCPAKKVYKKAAGSALMQDEGLVREILANVVNAVDIPVTLKTRTGTDNKNKNAINIAKIAEDCGISCISIHGRTRKQLYKGFAEYETIRRIKNAISIPVVANGDIQNSEDAKFIFKYTQVDGLMLGRITRGQPWIFKQINNELSGRNDIQVISNFEKKKTIVEHINTVYRYYSSKKLRNIEQKYINWYLYNLVDRNDDLFKQYRQEIFLSNDADYQLKKLEEILDRLL